STEAALAKLRSVVGDPDVAERVAQAIGLLERGAGGEETPWAVRRLLEAVAGSRPLVCVCDDIQWGEPPLLDLLRDVAARSEAPILLCCLARPELLEVSPEWPAIIELRPLSQSEGDLLLARALGGAALPAALRDRV